MKTSVVPKRAAVLSISQRPAAAQSEMACWSRTPRLSLQAVVDRDDGEAGLGGEVGVEMIVEARTADDPAAAVHVEDHAAGWPGRMQDAQGDAAVGRGNAQGLDANPAAAEPGGGDGLSRAAEGTAGPLAGLQPPAVGLEARHDAERSVDPGGRAAFGRGQLKAADSSGHGRRLGRTAALGDAAFGRRNQAPSAAFFSSSSSHSSSAFSSCSRARAAAVMARSKALGSRL